MCSIEPRLGTERTASRFAMIDSSTPQASSGLATALRDRTSCTIPNQPNRSLPVRPAPHTPCRSILPRHTLHSPVRQSETSSSVTIPTNQTDTTNSSSLGMIRIGIQNWQNDMPQPYVNIINLSTSMEKPPDAPIRGVKRNSPESENSVSTTNSTFIDISHSPDRSDFTKVDTVSSNIISEVPKSLAPEQEFSSKKKRRRRLKKDEEKLEGNVDQSSKIVPPLRLKKIQSLQDDGSSVATACGNLKKPETPEPIPGFRFYQPQPQEPEVVEDSSKYRIVTGTTPPYEDCLDSNSIHPDDEKDNKLNFKQNKLKVKLRELKRKTVELGREMLRTALTSPENSVQETIVSYEEQIAKLTNLLKKLPEAASSININDHVEELFPLPIVTSTISAAQVNSLPIITDIPSPEPPKLSPKDQNDFDHLNQAEVRNSPPVLAKVTCHGEDTEDTWQEFEGLRGLLKFSRKGKQRKSDKLTDVSTTVDSIHEEIDLDTKNHILDGELNGITKSEINLGEVKTIEIRTLGDVQEVMKIDLRNSPNLGEMIINSTSVLQEFDKRSEPTDNTIDTVNLAGALNVAVNNEDVRITTPMPIISSSCEDKTLANEKDLTIADQFPSLGRWLAKMSGKIPNNEVINQEEKKDQIVIESRSPAFHRNIQAFSQSKTPVVGSNGGGAEVGRGWREERWKGQEQRTQQTSGGYVNGSVGIGNQIVNQQAGQQLGPEFCQPQMNLGRYYPRNYPMDPYGIPYGYNHPAIAAATAASLWSGALLQYPYLRPRGLSPNYQSRLPANPLQYNMQLGPMPPPRAPPPYGLSGGAQTSQDTARVQNIPENPRHLPGPYDSNIMTKRNDYPAASSFQNTVNINNQRIQQSREQFGRVYGDPGARTPIPDVQREQMAYRQPWRSPMLPPGPIAPRNYPNWSSDPCSLLAALSPAVQNYPTPISMVQRHRNTKDTIEQVRNCETPHLGKVNYSPNTAKTLECSNCSSPGPLFKCLGCEVAFYCDETCQTRHWNRHVISCPKKMPKLKKVVP